MSIAKDGIRYLMKNVFGLEVRRLKNAPPSTAQLAARQLVASFRTFGIDLVLDIGANRGQFAQDIREAGFADRIVSFEPLAEAHALLEQASAGDARWIAHPRCALGDHDGQIEINVAGNSDSSSILPMLEAHRRAAPQSAYRGREQASLKTLDAVAAPYVQDARAPFLKIDTQGFEWQVLDGAHHTLPVIRGIMVELSLVPLYEGQHLWHEVMGRLEAAGFTLWAFTPTFSDVERGQTLQVDGIFYRTSRT